MQNAEVVGSAERFFQDDRNDQVIRDLCTEKNPNHGLLANLHLPNGDDA